jgi:hypothetical protein
MEALPRVILILVLISTGLFAVVAVGYGVFGVFLALSSKGGGFVGEEGFYASALFFVSLIALAVGAVAGIVSYVCWALWSRRPA